MMNNNNQMTGDPLLSMVPLQQQQQQWYDAALILAKDGFDINQTPDLPWDDMTEYLDTMEEFNSIDQTGQLDRDDEDFADMMDTSSFLSTPTCGGDQLLEQEKEEENDSLISIQGVTKLAVINCYVNGIETIEYTPNNNKPPISMTTAGNKMLHPATVIAITAKI